MPTAGFAPHYKNFFFILFIECRFSVQIIVCSLDWCGIYNRHIRKNFCCVWVSILYGLMHVVMYWTMKWCINETEINGGVWLSICWIEVCFFFLAFHSLRFERFSFLKIIFLMFAIFDFKTYFFLWSPFCKDFYWSFWGKCCYCFMMWYSYTPPKKQSKL